MEGRPVLIIPGQHGSSYRLHADNHVMENIGCAGIKAMLVQHAKVSRGGSCKPVKAQFQCRQHGL